MAVRLQVNRVTQIPMPEDDSKSAFSATYDHRKWRASWFFLIVAVLGFGGCSSSNSHSTIDPLELPMTHLNDTESIYCHLISKLDAKDGLILIENKTRLRFSADWNIDRSLGLVRDEISGGENNSLLQDFKSRNQAHNLLDERLACNGLNKIQIVDTDRLTGIFAGTDGWGILQEEYPGYQFVIVFSEIGYNEENDQALVFMEHNSGPKSGSGDYYVMVKGGSEWKVTKKINQWES